MATTEPIRDKKQIRKLTSYYRGLGQFRNHALIVVTLHTALRISDVLRLSWNDVYDFDAKKVKKSITIVEKKTGKSKTIAMHRAVRRALTLCTPKEEAQNQPLFLNGRTGEAISRIQAYRLIRAAAEAVEIEERVSCHSLRKTFGYHAWKDGISPAVLVEIYNHNSLAVTRRYLGVTQDDKDAVYMGIKLSA